jgi:hypothetical protein
MLVAAGVRLIAELCVCEAIPAFVEMLDVASVMTRILQTGAYRARVKCWKVATVLIARESPKALEFLMDPGTLALAVEQIDRDIPKLTIMSFLMSVCELAKRIRAHGIATSLGTKELMETLSEIEEALPRTELNDSALELLRALADIPRA